MNALVQAKKQQFMPKGILVSESLSPIEKRISGYPLEIACNLI